MPSAQDRYGEENGQNLRLIVAIARTATEHSRRTQQYLDTHGITMAQFGVLETLYHLGPQCIGEIMSRTLGTSGNMTVVVRNLEKDGLITRCYKENDRRTSLLHLTEKGEMLVGDIFPEHVSRVAEELSNLSADEKAQLLGLLKKLNGRI